MTDERFALLALGLYAETGAGMMIYEALDDGDYFLASWLGGVVIALIIMVWGLWKALGAREDR